MNQLTRLLLAVAFLALSAAPADAVIFTFGSRAAFDAANPGSVYETWDGFASGTTFADGTGSGGITYFSSAGDALVTSSFLVTTSPSGLGDTSVGFFGGQDSITFLFSFALTAFGIDINTFATAAGSYTGTTDGGDVIASVFDPFPSASTGQFLGFSSSTPFSSVTIAAPSGFTYTVDTLRAVPVPEPATLTLLGFGLAGLGAARRRARS